MNVVVMNRDRAEKYSNLKNERSSAVISVYSTYNEPAHITSTSQNGIEAVLSIQFNDVDSELEKYTPITNEKAAISAAFF